MSFEILNDMPLLLKIGFIEFNATILSLYLIGRLFRAERQLMELKKGIITNKNVKMTLSLL